jgi:NADPH:quinone reductase-like Zn-dependent oxidoreductase
MTTIRVAEALLFEKPEDVTHMGNVALPEPITTALSATRRRVEATYCPICGGWVEVRLQPVRLHCTGCGVEARP